MIISILQARAVGLSKQIGDMHDQLDQLRIEADTFQLLSTQEHHAIPRRMEVRVNIINGALSLCSCLLFGPTRLRSYLMRLVCQSISKSVCQSVAAVTQEPLKDFPISLNNSRNNIIRKDSEVRF